MRLLHICFAAVGLAMLACSRIADSAVSFVARAVDVLFAPLRPEPSIFRLDPTPRSIFETRRMGLA